MVVSVQQVKRQLGSYDVPYTTVHKSFLDFVQASKKLRFSRHVGTFLSTLFSHFFRSNFQKKRKVWKLVLTGGPCGGKTTGQARLSTFFENLGWKVFR